MTQLTRKQVREVVYYANAWCDEYSNGRPFKLKDFTRLLDTANAHRDLVAGVDRVIALHRRGVVSGLPGGMPGCEECSHGVTIGDEGGSGGVFWPCPTLRELAGISERAQWQAARKFEEWRLAHLAE